jgi:IS4 transposase
VISNEVIQRFVKHSPVTVMARLALGHVLERRWIDELFEEQRDSQYTRELLLSTTVQLMSLVSFGLRPSVNAAAKTMPELSVSVQALYGKINRTDPSVVRALVSASAQRLMPVVEELYAGQAVEQHGYQVRIVDGNHLAASEKRLKVLREFRGTALPGHSLVVFDPDRQLVTDLLPCEDAYTQERLLMQQLLPSVCAGQLWIADRNFSTRPILYGIEQAGGAFVIREHGVSPNPQALSKLQLVARTETGVVYEQPVQLVDEQGTAWQFRRIQIRLKKPTEDGETVIRLLSNVPAERMCAQQIAQIYRRRWRIESMFQRLESVVASEVRTLGAPRAALLAFGVAVLAYNVLLVLQSAVRAEQASKLADIELSSYYFAVEIRANYAGMMIAAPEEQWRAYESLDATQLVELLRSVAAHADPHVLRSNPRAPKIKKKPGSVPRLVASQHVATARLLGKKRGQKDL